MFPKSPAIQTSENYDIFKKIDWNRSIDKSNFKKLLKENRENFQLHRFPILVTKDYRIVDGQHRYEVCKELGCPIYFIRDSEIREDFRAVHSVNKAGKRHSLKDKLEMLYRAGDESAKKIYKVYDLYQGTFDVGTVASILTSTGNGSRAKEQIDSADTIRLNNYTKGIEVLDALFNCAIPDKGKKRMVFGLMSLYKLNGVHPKAIVKRAQAHPSKWIFPKTKQECERALAIAYNYNLDAKNKLKTSVAA